MPIIGNNSSAGKKPTTPTIGTAVDGGTGTTVNVPFTASAYIGKDTITYTALSNPGSISATSSGTPITVTGLTSGTAYTFTVTGNTNYGVASDASSASNSVTPIVPGSFDFIAKASGPISTVTFSNIPQTYRHLQLRWTGTSASSSLDQLRVQCNDNPPPGSHENTYLASSTAVGRDSGTLWNLPFTLGGGSSSSTHGYLDIYDYRSTQQRTGYSLCTVAQGSSSSTRYVTASGLQFASSDAITSLIVYSNSGSNLSNNFRVALYGIKDS